MQNKNKAFFVGLFVSLFCVFLPLFHVSADSSSSSGSSTSASTLVPCGLNEAYSGGTTDVCTLCHLIIGIKNIVDWIVKIAITVALVGITIAGVMYIVSAGSPGMMQTAKSFMTACIVGFALTLAAWLIVYLTMWVISAKTDLGLGSGKKWNEFNCSTTSNASTGSISSNGGGDGTGEDGDGGGDGSGASSSDSACCKTYINKEYTCTTIGLYDECNGELLSGACSTSKNTAICDSANALASSIAASKQAGCTKIVDAAKAMKNAGCAYCDGTNPPGCQPNGCKGKPAYTDVDDFIRSAYIQAGCDDPLVKLDYYLTYSITDGGASLKAGDAIFYYYTEKGNKYSNTVICENDGCKSVIFTSPEGKIEEEDGKFYLDQPGAEAIKASEYCSSC
ncbi:MAG: hypothetical protein HGB08_04820 [Candidatus Moranbacteria bacterium]|nr:hypothetical protein [Candidatus Moranbacteria bacterium]